MSDAGGEIRYKGVRKRKWGKYVAEIRSGRRSRISLGSYFTAEAAGRAYDAALLCLRGPQASSFNFPGSADLDLPAAHESNPSPDVIRTTAIAIGSEFDTVPARYHDYNMEAGPSADKTHFAEGVDEKDAADKVEEEEEMGELNDAKYLMQSPKGISFEERVEMSLLLPEDKETTQPYDPSEAFLILPEDKETTQPSDPSQAFSDLGTLDETICQAAPPKPPAN